MNRLSTTLALGAALLAFSLPAAAQRAAEQYIPIGESPGVSGTELAILGEITRVDYDNYVMTVKSGGETRRIKVDASTRYYLDRTDRRRSNTLGDFRDCEAGRRVEVMFEDDGKAGWVKIDAD